MAEAKLVKKSNPDGWEPWITLTLSKREAAGIQVLIGGMHANSMGTDNIHDKIGEFLDAEADDMTWRLPHLPYTDQDAEEKAGEALDKLFGKV